MVCCCGQCIKVSMDAIAFGALCSTEHKLIDCFASFRSSMGSEHQATLEVLPAADTAPLARLDSTGRASKHKHRWRSFAPSCGHIEVNHCSSQWDTASDTVWLSVPNNLQRHRHINVSYSRQPQHRTFESSSLPRSDQSVTRSTNATAE